MTETSDRIEKEIVIAAPPARVWRALVDGKEFGQWFGARVPEGAFVPGARVRGAITHPAYAHVTVELQIERVEEGRLLSWRWHPHAIEAGRDYSAEPTTLVVFELDEVPGGTRLRVVESGFAAIPAARRAEAWRGNDAGWAGQLRNIERHVTGAR